MKTALASLDLRRASSLGSALDALRDEPRTVLAGGTDVYVGLNFGTQKARTFLDVWGVDELREIRVADDVLSIGALASYTTIRASTTVRERLPMLVDAAGQVGGVQIQNRGTLGGNVANASPAGDSIPVLMAADGVVVLRSASDERRVPVADFFTGYRATVRRPDELIVAIEIPRVDGAQFFRKVGTRAAQAISKVAFAGVRGANPRVALGSVGPTVVRARKTEAALAAGADVREAAEVLATEISPIDDVRSTGEYRRAVAKRVLVRWWGAGRE